MPVDYNKISKTFSHSRKSMKWEEIHFLIDFLKSQNIQEVKILDIGCGSGRLLWELQESGLVSDTEKYLWIDSSSGMIVEAQKNYPGFNFQVLDMKDCEKLGEKFDLIFFIASFHHLENYEERLETLKKAITILSDWWYICMTNWALKSSLNLQKYSSSEIWGSKNCYSSSDFMIKCWDYQRFYHCFHTSELEELAKNAWGKLIENSVHKSKKNIISIIQKQ